MDPYLIFTFLTLPLIVNGLVGYDCSGEGLNITTLSLLDIGTCEVDDLEPVNTEVYMQLLQLSDFDRISVTQCLVKIDRTVYHCGMHSHVSVVKGGRKEYLRELGADGCRRLHETGSLTLGSAVIDRLQPNTTHWRSVTLAGRAGTDATCEGAPYSDGYGEWERVIVQASVKIVLRTFEASVKKSSKEIILPSGTRCSTASRMCKDTDGSETYWSIAATDSCRFDHYDVIYEGLANRLSPKQNQTSPIIYTVTTRETTFALTKLEGKEINVCGYKLYPTEHPRLLILETQKGRTFKTRAKIALNDLDIFAYVNSKFLYVEKHMKTQLTQLYRDIMEQKCALETQVLRNALSLASIAPDEMAFRIMKTPGYTAITSEEVIHLIKCVPVECKIRHTENCFNELPVTYRNTSYFVIPRSRILTRKGTQRDCNNLIPSMYKIQDTWYRIDNRPTEILAPPIIQPLTKPKWKYISPDYLATSGIYTPEDLDRLRDHIMFPVERPYTLNTIARGAMGQTIEHGSVSMMGLLDEQALNHIAENTGKRIWSGFITFGSASAGVLAIFVIARLAKLVIDTMIHGYALHSVYGWSIHLLGAIWSSVTNLLLHLGNPRSKPPTQEYIFVNAESAAALQGTNLPGSTNSPTAPAPETRPDQENKDVNNETSYGELRKYLNRVKYSP